MPSLGVGKLLRRFLVLVLLQFFLFVGSELLAAEKPPPAFASTSQVLGTPSDPLAMIAACLSDKDLRKLFLVRNLLQPQPPLSAEETEARAAVHKYLLEPRVLLEGQDYWVRWVAVKHKPELAERIFAVQNSYGLALDPAFPEKKWHFLWNEELLQAAQTGQEPTYLAAFSKKTAEKLRAFLEPRQAAAFAQTPAIGQQARRKFALQTLLAMLQTHTILWDGARGAVSDTVHSLSDVAWNSAADSAWSAARDCAWDGVSEAILPASLIAWSAVISVASDIRSVILSVVDVASSDLLFILPSSLDTTQQGRLIWRVAEMAVHIYFLRNFDTILTGIFLSLDKADVGLQARADVVFASPESWALLKDRYFSRLKPEAVYFLLPWLDAIDVLSGVIPAADPAEEGAHPAKAGVASCGYRYHACTLF